MPVVAILFVVALVVILVVGRVLVLPWVRRRAQRHEDGVRQRDHAGMRDDEAAESRSVHAELAEARAHDAGQEDRPEGTGSAA